MIQLPNVKYIKFGSRRRFGIELELNEKIELANLADIVRNTDPDRHVQAEANYNHSYNNDYWHVKLDRSCANDPKTTGLPKGKEIASYVAKGFKDIKKIGRMVRAVREAGAEVNDNCAFHVHGEARDLNSDQMAVLVANWMRMEKIVSEILPKHRRDNKYCRLMTQRFEVSPTKCYTPSVFYNIVRPRNFGDADRRVAFNLVNYARGDRSTVELRLPESSLDPRDAKNWIRFFINFIDVNKLAPFPEAIVPASGLMETMKIAGLHSENPFYILSSALRDTKVWFMRRLLKHSAKKKLREEAEWFLQMMSIPEPKEPEKDPEKTWITSESALAWKTFFSG